MMRPNCIICEYYIAKNFSARPVNRRGIRTPRQLTFGLPSSHIRPCACSA